jgi:hypothetical protein
MDRYVGVLYEIVTRGFNTNSYKFALWRALASLAPSTDEENPEVKYHIRQGIDPDKDPIVMKLVRQLVNAGMITQAENLRDFQRRMPKEHMKLLAGVARGAFDDVIPRFHRRFGLGALHRGV